MPNSLTSADIAKKILEERQLLFKVQKEGTLEAWSLILEKPEYWSLRHDEKTYSVKNMSDHELQQSVIEDLLFVAHEINMGSSAIYPIGQAVRHLRNPVNHALDQCLRIFKAINEVMTKGYVLSNIDSKHQVTLHLNPSLIEKAQEFSGVYLSDFSESWDDVIESIVSLGGEELLKDTIEEIMIKFKDS